MALRSFSTLTAAGPAARPLQPKNTASLALISTRTDYCVERENQTGRLCASSNGLSWRSSANYVHMLDGTTRFLSKSMATNYIAVNRGSTFRCATIEEIEAEKFLIEKEARERMEKTIETVRSNFNAVRTGRANPAMLDGIEVEYYGTPVTLKSIAQISTPDASSLLVQPFDKSSLKVIEKAIVGSDLGLTPNNDGEAIRLVIPQLTSERRKEFSKLVARQAEEGKVAIRNIRRDAIKAYEKLEKEKKLSEDNVKDLSSDLQKLTDGYMKKLDSLLKQKEKELLTV
ncbi:ribosome-recycling factor, chloroplastic isoform X2 [Phalaenopsis equestris]|uniref:ribosome-recycling factor, chloroplastic isoform X2 n=1 Tax=Phalaenopsis equestris TaxID=78828 RepID=UPI0009E45FFF|nr:ribosome-recycling factor, chloroplastic isoform X2 [Phalaenopsis equestris]